ncbi:tetratricopeptide repeat protein [Streptomyces sp. NPDC056987]|uniref:tetratricopeptide repeat protein n=1 Tax=Streptomyces sp. NPDC056987 TaxID=3345988 RepID=UPI003625D65A
MTAELSPEDIRRALWENDSAPNGLARNARGEELVAAAERTGDPDVLRRALLSLVQAYEYSTERGKMLVPFARLLQEWDRDPSGFSGADTHTFHWVFKWASSGMLTLPEMPLTTIEHWLTEMERRYRTAGFTERAVRQAEFELADDSGDPERAARAFAAWTAAERDRMANCHACELNDQGSYRVRQGDDEKALETWEPVLADRLRCAEEPHRTLAQSLLPLVRTGRLDEARAHHLKGYRLARGNESLLPSIGLHIEFCALTGNEGRGLEILAEHGTHLDSHGNPWARLQFIGGVLTLLRRLPALGLGDQPAVPGAVAGEPRTVAGLLALLDDEATALAARFDLRNGNDTVSARLARRLAAAPLVDTLPLGIRAPRLAPAPAVAAVAREDAAPAVTVTRLAREARELRGQGHPRAASVWDRIEALVATRTTAEPGTAEPGAAESVVPEPLLVAELLEHRALRAGRAGDPGARPLLEETAAAYRAAEEPGRAALAELQIVFAAAQSGEPPEEIRRLLATAAASADALDPGEPTRTRRIASVALSGARLGAVLRHQESGHDPATAEADQARLDADLAGFVTEFGGRDAEEPAAELADLLAGAEKQRAELAWQAGDAERAEALFSSSARRGTAAGRPWDAAEPLARRAALLMALGREEEAEEAARTAVAYGTELIDPDELGRLRLTLADILYQQYGKEAEAAEYALEAAHWLDEAGESAGAGAYARLLLAQAYAETGRAAEAAEVLESALPDLLRQGEPRAVRAREALAGILRALGDQRGAAEQYLLAAEVAKGWENQQPHARFATLAAECLSGAGLRDEAVAAYHRAVELWQGTGEPVGAARALRSVAWLEVRAGNADAAKELMARSLAAVEGDGDELLLERARGWYQTGELLLDLLDEDADENDEGDEYEEGDDAAGKADREAGGEADAVREEAIRLLEQGATALAGLGVLDERVRCVVRVAWTEQELGRREAGARRLRALVEEVAATDTDEARAMVPRLRNNLKHLES